MGSRQRQVAFFIHFRIRGLGQLVRARNIRTIGQLASLTELEIDGLPIRQPKVPTTKSALMVFAEQWKNKKDKNNKQKSEPKSKPGKLFKLLYSCLYEGQSNTSK